MREIRDRVRQKRAEGAIPNIVVDFSQPNLGRIASATAEIARKPPVPDTLRGRAGARLIGILQRMLLWYSAPIIKFAHAVQETLQDYSSALQLLAAAQEENKNRLAEVERKAADTDRQVHGLRCTMEDAELDAILRRLRETERELLHLKAQTAVQDRRLATVLEEARRRLPEPFDQEQLQVLANEGHKRLESFYSSFETRFRGSSEEIRERLRVYLPHVRNAIAGRLEPTILDIGCGRGEWLELLRDEGIRARGMDSNSTVVARCRETGLEVDAGDCLRYLAARPDASVDVVTAIHLVEHLPWEAFLTLLDEIVRVLRPGGMFILETPNPENILVATNNFYFDPTHVKPLPVKTTRFAVESRGLCRVEVLFLQPYPEAMHVEGDSELCRRFNQFFYGAQDYAVIGHKP